MRNEARSTVLTGLEVFLAEGLPELQGRRVGLITNHTGVDRRFRSSADLLHMSDRLKLAALFGPEHGVRGDAQAGVHVKATTDGRTGLPVWSLYGDSRRPAPGMLAGLEALIFDLQDIGVRYATYISTMAYTQEAAAAAGLTFVVLDRPNPIGGVKVEGNLLDPAWRSFVGAHPLPVCHGMTVGELARLFAAENGWLEPIIVPMRGWRREQWFDQTGLPWVQPSPNLPTLDSVTLYPATCLVEGTNVSEGRGTTRPFELLGAPWIDPFRFQEELARRSLPGVAFRPAYFTPSFSKYAGVACAGVQIHITDRHAAQPFELGLHILHTLKRHDPAAFAFNRGADGRYFIDLLFGSDEPRRALHSGAEVDDLMAAWFDVVPRFEERRHRCLLYAE
jgi:uncharacterized protein YbbC (DUF1343 family)